MMIKSRKLPKINEASVRKEFFNFTGIPESEIDEIQEAFPFALTCTVHTKTRTFHCVLRRDGRVKGGSFYEEA